MTRPLALPPGACGDLRQLSNVTPSTHSHWLYSIEAVFFLIFFLYDYVQTAVITGGRGPAGVGGVRRGAVRRARARCSPPRGPVPAAGAEPCEIYTVSCRI